MQGVVGVAATVALSLCCVLGCHPQQGSVSVGDGAGADALRELACSPSAELLGEVLTSDGGRGRDVERSPAVGEGEGGAKEEAGCDRVDMDSLDGSFTERCTEHMRLDGMASDPHALWPDFSEVDAESEWVEESGDDGLSEEVEAGSALEELDDDLTGVVQALSFRGLHWIPEPLVREAVRTPVGEELRRESVVADVRRLYALAVFSDVAVSAETVEGGLRVIFDVTERSLIEGVFFTGLAPSSRVPRRLRALVGDVFDPARAWRALELLRASLLTEGYLENRGEVRYHRMETGEVALCFRMTPGSQYRIAQFEIAGNRHIDDETIMAQLRNDEGRVNVVGGIFREDLLESDQERIAALYYDRGFIDVLLDPLTIDISREDASVSIELYITEGAVFTLGEVSVVGALEMGPDEVADVLELREGAIFERSQIARAIQAVRAIARRRGLRSPGVTPTPRIDRPSHRVDLELVVSEEP